MVRRFSERWKLCARYCNMSTCQTTMCHRSCHNGNHGNGMWNTASMAGKAIWCHWSPVLTTIRSHPVTFKTHRALMTPPQHPAPCNHMKAPAWMQSAHLSTIICFRSLELSMYDLHSPNNTTPHALHVFKYWSARLLQQTQKEREPEERKEEEEEYARMVEMSWKNTPAEERGREVWGIFNFGEKSNSIAEGGTLGCCSWKPR